MCASASGHKSSAAKSPSPPCAASGSGGALSGEGVSVAMPRLAVVREKLKKTVKFVEQPTVVLIVGNDADGYTFDNKNPDGTPAVSQTTMRKKKRKKRLFWPCPIEAEILAHARATNLMLGIEYPLGPVHCIYHTGRRPW